MVEICAYYYPGWHDRPNVSYSEWDLVRRAEPYFEGHYQPRVPIGGYYDDSQPATVAAQAALAARYGIDAFIFLWYWKRGHIELEQPLHHFAQLDIAMRFSLMWCWKMPKADLPAVPGHESELERQRWVDTDPGDFARMIDHCCAGYFTKPGYRTIDGKPILLLYSVEGPISNCNLTKLIKSLIIMPNKLNNKYYFQFFIDRSIIHLSIFNFSILGRNIQYNITTISLPQLTSLHNHYICPPFLTPPTSILYTSAIHKIK